MAPILLVDDSDLMLRVLSAALCEHEVARFSSPLMALRAVRSGARFSALVLDYEMGEMNGVELLGAIAAYDPELAERVVFTTGTPESVRRELPDALVLAKPFEPEDLRSAVAALLEPDSTCSLEQEARAGLADALRVPRPPERSG